MVVRAAQGLCSSADDAWLMTQIADGDHGAFAALVERYQQMVFALAYRHLGSRADAEDMAQETFVRLYQAAPRYRQAAPLRAYLLTITSRLCLNRSARAPRRREQGVDGSALEQFATVDAGPEQELLGRERALAVQRAVLALPDDQRLALLLFRFEGLSCEAVAEAMGKSVAAVTSLLWRARERLGHELEEFIGDDKTRKVLPARRFESLS